MGIAVNHVTVQNILTRTGGFLKQVASHSLQPFAGCSFGCSACGVGCYVRHNSYLTRGREWGSFLDIRTNAAESYAASYEAQRHWARRTFGRFAVFMSSSTDPFLPQEDRAGVTRRILEMMLTLPPDELILQTHTHRVVKYLDLYPPLTKVCDLRFHISIETDRASIPGLPPPPSPVERRFQAVKTLKDAGLRVVVVVAPLLPIDNPPAFFARIAASADAVVIDHFIEGDGTPDGRRTKKSVLPEVMAAIEPRSVELEYRDAMVAIARQIMPGRVGVSAAGFAGKYA